MVVLGSLLRGKKFATTLMGIKVVPDQLVLLSIFAKNVKVQVTDSLAAAPKQLLGLINQILLWIKISINLLCD